MDQRPINTTVAKPMATFTLCAPRGCLLTDGYMSFGLSGAVDSINMVNGDVTVAWVDNQPHAEDYYLQRREQVWSVYCLSTQFCILPEISKLAHFYP